MGVNSLPKTITEPPNTECMILFNFSKALKKSCAALSTCRVQSHETVAPEALRLRHMEMEWEMNREILLKFSMNL